MYENAKSKGKKGTLVLSDCCPGQRKLTSSFPGKDIDLSKKTIKHATEEAGKGESGTGDRTRQAKSFVRSGPARYFNTKNPPEEAKTKNAGKGE